MMIKITVNTAMGVNEFQRLLHSLRSYSCTDPVVPFPGVAKYYDESGKATKLLGSVQFYQLKTLGVVMNQLSPYQPYITSHHKRLIIHLTKVNPFDRSKIIDGLRHHAGQSDYTPFSQDFD